MSTSVKIFVSVLAVLGYGVAPVSLVWGWALWVRYSKPWTISGVLAFIGFALASVSGILGVAVIVFARAGAASIGSQLFRWIFLAGLLSSLVGILFATGGIWRRGPLRWLAPAGALSTLAFWLLVTLFID
jgi:hypothetical protein